MRRADDTMLVPVDERALPLRVRTPENEDKMLALLGQSTNNRIGERLPPLPLMRPRTMRRDRQRGVEKEDALVGPAQ